MRWTLLCLALAACGKPCPLVCNSNAECPGGYYCLNQVVCLRDCLHCPSATGCAAIHDNCGGCGNACSASQVCSVTGSCAAGCNAGETNCAGACTTLASDRLNCGACNNACARDQTCAGGKCIRVDTCQ